MTQPNEQVMLQPPEVVTTKDHLYLTDMLNWNLNAAKKTHAAAEQAQLGDVTEMLHTIGQMHTRHYDMLLKHLETKPLN